MSVLASSIADKKRLIIKNPDGSYLYCNKSDEKDEMLVVNKINNNEINLYNQNQNANLNMFPDNFTISDEELQYILENRDQSEDTNLMEQILSVYRKNQFFFCFLFILEMSLSCLLLMITWKRKEYSIMVMQNLYRDISPIQAALIFHGIFIINCFANLILYPLGFFALLTKKIQMMKFFSSFSLYCGLSSIFIVYLNV